MLRFSVLFFVASILAFFFSLSAQAQDTTTTTTTIVEKPVIMTPVPQSVNCSTVAAHWEGDVWVNAQTICKYENRPEGVAWVQDYWACTVYSNGECTNWEYRPGHWVKTLP